MKTIRIFTAAFLTLALLLSGCVLVDSSIGLGPDDNRSAVVGSGRVISVTLGFRNFRRIHLSHGFKAKIEKSNSYSVKIETDDNIEAYVQAYQSGEDIYVGLDDNNYRSATLNVIIETPDISTIEASGACAVTLNGFELSHRVELMGSGASVFRGSLIATDVVLMLSGGGTVELTGHAETVDINGSGATVLRLLSFPVQTCKAVLSGGSVSDVSVSDLLEVSLSGASVFRYRGNPVTRIIGVSGGSVIQRLS